MKRTALLLLAFVGLSLAACAPNAPDPERLSASFFEDGKEAILDTLKDQNVDKPRYTTARGILFHYQPDVMRETVAAMRAQQDLMLAIVSGRDSATLLRLDAEQSRTQQQALRTVGRMHEELETTVGTDTWKVTSAKLEKKYYHYFKYTK